MERTDEFLEAVHAALWDPTVPGLKATVPVELEAAATLYHQGELSEARRKLKPIARKKDALGSEARRLIMALDGAEEFWIKEFEEAVAQKEAETFVEWRDAILNGLPGSDSAKAVKSLWKKARKADELFERRVTSADEVLKITVKRPLRFPLRVTRKGKAFVKHLAKYIEEAPYSNSWRVSGARAVLEAYERAGK